MHQPRSIWWAHASWPMAAFVVLATLLESTHLDRTLAAAWYFDAAHHSWIGANAIWANAIVHTGGSWAIRSIAALALLLWAGSLCVPALHRTSRTAAFILVSMTLSMALVGLLKQLSNIDCPWDLQEFGGRFPFVPLLADRPDSLRPAHCFPAAHASSGFTLVVFYFALREHHAGLARWALWMSVLVGLVFGIAQQARGAHFLSHDVWSAFLVWITSLSVYVFAFGATLSRSPAADQNSTERCCTRAIRELCRDQAISITRRHPKFCWLRRQHRCHACADVGHHNARRQRFPPTKLKAAGTRSHAAHRGIDDALLPESGQG